MRATINSSKHIVQNSLGVIAAGAIGSTTLAAGVSVNAVNLSTEVRDGCVIKAIFLEEWLRGGDDAAGSTYIFILEKVSGDTTPPTVADMANLHAYHNKKNILFTSMGLINDDSSVATPVTRMWHKIPKGKQRFGLDDRIKIHILSQTGSTDFCGCAIYKEYF